MKTDPEELHKLRLSQPKRTKEEAYEQMEKHLKDSDTKDIVNYKLLSANDNIEVADEALLDDCITWETVNKWYIGCNYNPSVFVPMRRKI